MKKIWLSMFYSIRVGEDPDSVFLKNQRNQNQVKMIWINPFLLRQRSYHSEGTGVTSLFHFHPRVLMCFRAPLRPRKMDKFLFLGTRTRFVTTKRIMVTPPLTISFINYFIYEFHSNRKKIHVYPTETEFVTCYPLAQPAKIYLRGKDDSFGST